MGLGDWGTSIDTEVSVLTFSILALLTMCLLLSHTLHSAYPWTTAMLPEAAVSILVGLLAGGIIEIVTLTDKYKDSSVDLIEFDPVTFLVIQVRRASEGATRALFMRG